MTNALVGSVQEKLTARDLDASGVLVAVKRKRWGEKVVATLVVGLFVWLVWRVVVNPNVHWDVFFAYLFHREILEGMATTLQLTLISVSIAFVLAVVLAFMRQSGNPVLQIASSFYVWLFRATPLLVQLILWFNLALLFPVLGLGIPGTAIGISWDTNAVVTPFMAAILGLSLHEAAYMSEVVRGGILSVPKGQIEAAQSIGMTRTFAMWKIVLPQAIRVIIPPAGNQVIILLKGSSIVSVIGGGDLLTAAQNLYSINYEVIALLFVASFWYMFIIAILGIGQRYLEKRHDVLQRKRGVVRADAGAEV